VIGTLPTLVSVAQGRFDASTILIQAVLAVGLLIGYLARR
jgi:hypothetical protein